MVAKWVFEYFTDPATWTAFDAKLRHIDEILNGHEEAQLSIINSSANRTFVSTNKTVQIKYDGNVIFTGLLSAHEYGTSNISCILYNSVFEALKTKTFTATYATAEAANVIAAAICAEAGVTLGSCPSTPIAVRFDEANCYDALMFLCDCLNSDFSTSGNIFNIAARGSAKSVTNYKIKSRGIDRSKQRDKIRVKGTDVNGVEIVGEAGSGTNVQVFREKKANDVATLNTLASKYLAELNTISKGAPIEVPIEEGYNIYPGDTIPISNARYNLNDTYRIMRISKYPTKVSFQLEKQKPTLEAKLLDFKKYEDIGIYQISGAGEEIDPVVLSYQSLELLIPMDEGSGAFLADYGPYWRQDICYNHTWATGSEGTSLEFAGTGYATCGVDIDLDGLDELTISVWVNPAANGADVNYLVHKENCFSLQHYTTDNKIRFQVYVAGDWHELVTDANAVPLSTRVHVVAKYDGSKMYIYIDSVLAKEISQIGSFGDSSNTLYLGAKDSSQGFLTGKIGMLFIFSRALFESEIADLYHYGKISVPPALVSNSIDGQGIQAHYHMNEGQGTVINDSSANENSGTINGATWTDGPTSRFLAFNGAAYVTCGQQLDLGGVGRTKLSLCCWTTLSSHSADENYLFYKEGQYYLQHYGLTDQIRFAVYIGGAWRIITTESHVAPLNERLFVVGVYDGSFLRIYINGTERAKQSQTGALEPAPGVELYLGAKSPTDGGLNGALTECMIWNRYLNRSEVVTLYFFPLTRLMSLGTAGGSMPIRRTYGVCKEYLNRGMGIGCIIPPFTPVETTLRGNDSTSSHCVSDPDPIVESAAYQFGQAVDETSIDRVEAPQLWTNGVLGLNGTGSSSTSVINNIVGSLFTTPAVVPTLTQGSAYVLCTTANKTMRMAIYKHSTLALIVQSTAITVTANASAQRIWFTFPATNLEASTDYIVVVWSSSASGTGALYYAAGSANQGHTQALTYTTNFPNPMVVGAHNSNKYCCYVGYYY